MPFLFEKLIDDAWLTGSTNLLEATLAIQRVALGFSFVSPKSSAPNVLAAPVGPVPPPRAATPRRTRAKHAMPRATDVKAFPEPAPLALQSPASVEGAFETHSFTGRSGTRSFRLFVPAGHAERALPLVVMLHGCRQSPEDFAAGTRMNEVAQERGFFVLYPAQAPRSNHSKCWNWFVPGDQKRGGGEPDLLAEMTRHVIATHRIDPARVYVAGMSAGAAMADILGREYADLFAAVGIHSGLPQGAAHDVASAFAVMSHGHRDGATPSQGTIELRPTAPAIVFHGDADGVVHSSNGDRVVRAALAAGGIVESTDPAASSRRSIAGRAVTHTVHRRPRARAGEPSIVEQWVLHGGGHAWSGGSHAGSYTDASGPDATREMVRFFEEHPLHSAP